jgi:hypothetical protein
MIHDPDLLLFPDRMVVDAKLEVVDWLTWATTQGLIA